MDKKLKLELKNKYKITAIIPARGGSKRITKKNIKKYAEKPLIYWSIKLALESIMIDNVIVSTDDEEIAETAIKYGASVPYYRPKDISGDLSTDYEFMEHYIEWINNHKNKNKYHTDIIVHLRPTYPNRKLEILDDAIYQYLKVVDNYDSLRTVCEMDKPAFKMYKMIGNELIPLFKEINGINEPYNMPAQLLPKTYWHNGYLDILKVDTITKKKSMSGDKIFSYVMDKNEIYDIDTIEEWELSEQKFINYIEIN